MNKSLIVLSVIFFNVCSAFSQTVTEFPAYTDFKSYRNATEEKPVVIGKMRALLAQSNKLSAKQLTNVQYHLGRLYEEEDIADSAIVYYEKSLIGEPDYEVAHRALGFIYLNKTKEAVSAINAAKQSQNTEANAKAFAQYKLLVLKAIPHLEKYQACDADDDTLMIITNLYKSIKDTESINSLPARLKAMGNKCVTLLDDE